MAEVYFLLHEIDDDKCLLLFVIVCRIALRQGRQRGWFTYTDLLVLSGDPEVAKLATYLSKEISKVTG